MQTGWNRCYMKKIINPIINNWSFIFVLFPVVFNLIMLYPETAIKMDLNDNVFAYTLIARMNLTLTEILRSPFPVFRLPLLIDHWTPEWAMGFPVFSYYQHIPHLTVVLLYRIFQFASRLMPSVSFSLLEIFNWTKYLMLACFPFSVYVSARKFDFSRLAASSSALVSTLISTQYLYGTDYNALVFRGSGMYTQLWGIFFLPLAISSVYRSLKYHGEYLTAIVFLSLSLAGHLVFGYIAVLSTPLLYLVFIFHEWSMQFDQKKKQSTKLLGEIIIRYAKRLAVILCSSFVLLSYWIVPLVVNSSYQNKSLWDDLTKFNSYGALQIIKWLINGQIFDNGRFPVLTILVAMGFFYSLYSYFNHHKKWQVALFLPLLFSFWLILYFGRYTFGPLFNLLPMSEGLHGHRLINGVHVAGIFLIGLSVEWLFWLLYPSYSDLQLSLERKSRLDGYIPKNSVTNMGLFGITRIKQPRLAILIFMPVIALILSPVVKERYDYLRHNAVLLHNATESYGKEILDFNKTVDIIKSESPARINIGRPGNWGRSFGIGEFSSYFGMSVNNLDTIGFEPESWSLNTDIEQFFSEYDPDYYNTFNIGYIVAPKEEKFALEGVEFAKKIGVYGKFNVFRVDTKNLTAGNLQNFEFINSDLLIYTNKNYKFNLDRLWLGSTLMKKLNHPTVAFDQNFDPSPYKYVITMLDLANYQIGHAKNIKSDKVPLNIFYQNPFSANPDVLNISTPSGSVLQEIKKPNYYSAKVETPKNAILMLKVTYHPFWQVKIDQKPVDKFMVEPAFMAIRIPAGKHFVEFSYFPAWYKNILLIASVFTLPVLWLILKKKEKPPA